MKTIILGLFILFSNAIYAQSNCCSVTIGNQIWMKNNLQTVTYRNGDSIPLVTDPSVWSTLTTGAYCYPNGNPSNVATYGLLYNWYAVNDPRGLAPHTWHIPTVAEWNLLSNTLGGEAYAGGKMKVVGFEFWTAPNIGATNESGFSGLPGGMRNIPYGTFDYHKLFGFWWSTTENGSSNAWYRSLDYNNSGLNPANANKKSGFSVRCLKN